MKVYFPHKTVSWRAWTLVASVLLAAPAMAMEAEIDIGQTMPYSGPVSAAGTFGLTERAFFNRLNRQGGINGRKINLISLDDGYSPPKTLDQTRRLVEEDHVLAIVGTVGTPTNAAIQRYLNQMKVPQLFISTGATRWGDPQHFPWTMAWQPTYQAEGGAFAHYTLNNIKDPKIAILAQNDDFGRDYVKGFKDGLGAAADRLIVAEATYETSDPTVDSQIVTLQASGATVFLNVTTQKFAAQAIRKAADIGWAPLQFVTSIGASIGTVLKPAGVDRARGIVSARYLKDTTDPTWKNDKGMQDFLAFMREELPNIDISDAGASGGYSIAMTFAEVVRRCGDDLSRENIMRQSTNLKHLELPMLLPGIYVDTRPDNYHPMRQLHLARFDGTTWVLLGDVIGQ